MQYILKDAFQASDGKITARYTAEFDGQTAAVEGTLTLPASGTRNEWLKEAGKLICSRHKSSGLLGELQQLIDEGQPIDFSEEAGDGLPS